MWRYFTKSQSVRYLDVLQDCVRSYASHLWYKDTAGHMDATLGNGGNAGVAERRKYIAESRVVEMMGRLHVHVFLHIRFSSSMV